MYHFCCCVNDEDSASDCNSDTVAPPASAAPNAIAKSPGPMPDCRAAVAAPTPGKITEREKMSISVFVVDKSGAAATRRVEAAISSVAAAPDGEEESLFSEGEMIPASATYLENVFASDSIGEMLGTIKDLAIDEYVGREEASFLLLLLLLLLV